MAGAFFGRRERFGSAARALRRPLWRIHPSYSDSIALIVFDGSAWLLLVVQSDDAGQAEMMELADFWNIEFWVRHVRGGFHFGAALIALLLGPIVLARRKGTDSHRLLGRIWVVLMLTVNLSALTMYGVNGLPNLFHGFALLSLWALVPGFLAIRRYTKDRQAQHLIAHQMCMHWAYFGLAAAGVWQVATRYSVLSGNSSFVAALWVLGGLTGLASWGFGRWLKQRFEEPVAVG